MTPFVPIADGAQVEVLFTLRGKVYENRLWFTTRQPPITQQQLDDLAAGVASWHSTQIMPYLSSELVLVAVVAYDWTSTPPAFFGVTTPGTAGGNLSGSHSATVAIKVNLAWPTRYRLKQNANYVLGVPLDQVDTNTYSATLRQQLKDAYANLIDLAAVFGPFPAWEWVVASSYLGGVLRASQFVAPCIGTRYRSPYVGQRRDRKAT